jgi:hypothetical protein
MEPHGNARDAILRFFAGAEEPARRKNSSSHEHRALPVHVLPLEGIRQVKQERFPLRIDPPGETVRKRATIALQGIIMLVFASAVKGYVSGPVTSGTRIWTDPERREGEEGIHDTLSYVQQQSPFSGYEALKPPAPRRSRCQQTFLSASCSSFRALSPSSHPFSNSETRHTPFPPPCI